MTSRDDPQNVAEALVDAVEHHYSQFLGRPSALNVVPLLGHPAGHYHIVEYEDRPCQGAVTLATLGLSAVPLHMFRQELLFCCYKRFVIPDLITLIRVVAQMITDSQHPLFHGDTLPPAGPLLETTPMEALYTATLMYFNTDAQQFDTLQVGTLRVLIAWLLPVYRTEVEWIQKYGYDAFEDLIVELDPDGLNLARPPIV
jgi:hypothetical protein